MQVTVKRTNGKPFHNDFGTPCATTDFTVFQGTGFQTYHHLDVGHFGKNICAIHKERPPYQSTRSLKAAVTRMLHNRGYTVLGYYE